MARIKIGYHDRGVAIRRPSDRDMTRSTAVTCADTGDGRSSCSVKVPHPALEEHVCVILDHPHNHPKLVLGEPCTASDRDIYMTEADRALRRRPY